MDIANLLWGFRGVSPTDRIRKLQCLSYAYSTRSAARVEQSFDAFLSDIPPEIENVNFGTTAEDAYLTPILASLSSHIGDLDVFAWSVLNRTVRQLTSQTRLEIEGVRGAPEAICIDGFASAFATSLMANANDIAGMLVCTDEVQSIPEGLLGYPHIRLVQENIAYAPATDMASRMHRTRLGAIAVNLASMPDRDFSFSERYSSLAAFVTPYTFYAVSGSAEATAKAAGVLQTAYPQARILTRFYKLQRAGCAELRGVLVASGIESLPEPRLEGRFTKKFKYLKAGDVLEENKSIKVIEYKQSETSLLKKPIYISSTSPLIPEFRRRFEMAAEVFHHAAILKDGIYLPYKGVHDHYVTLTRDGQILFDYCIEERIAESSKYFSTSSIGEDNTRSTRVDFDKIIRVSGAVVPLFFTPSLHTLHGHFLVQCLPRIKMMREVAPDAKILLPKGARKKQLEMLRLLGVPDDRWVFMPDNTAVQADELIIPRAWPLVFSAYTASIYQELVENAGPVDLPATPRILLSREARMTWRNMLNYDAIKALLEEKHGFRTIRPELFSLAEEIHIFNKVDIVAGAEGAGMYGGVFAKPSSVFMTITDEDYVMPIIPSLALHRGFNIAYVLGESMRAAPDMKRWLPWMHCDFVVDPMAVDSAVSFIADYLK